MNRRYIIVSLSLISLLFVLGQFYLYRFLVLSEMKTVSVSNMPLQTREENAEIDALDAVLLESLATFSGVERPDFTKKQRGLTSHLWVDRCEVTKAAFGQFIAWSENKRALVVKHTKTPDSWRFSSSVSDHRVAGQPTVPVGGVTFFDAFAYCHSAGGRLLTSFEYQALAMGAERRLYPWGNTFTEELWPYDNPWLNAYRACDQHSVDVTEEKVAHLASHVSEWVWDVSRKTPVIQGSQGNQVAPDVFALTVVQQVADFNTRNNFTGFRCAYDNTVTNTPWLSVVDAIHVEPKALTVGVPETSLLPGLMRHMEVEAYPFIASLLKGPEFTRMKKVMASEVSVKQYAYFLRDPFVHVKFYANANEPEGIDYTPLDWETQLKNESMAVRAVNWWSAYAFSRWVGGRLPTETEWVYLFSNGGKTPFPWGEELLYLGVTQAYPRKQPAPIDAKTFDVNHQGVRHLSGNVSEWTSTLQTGPTGHRLIVKGGNFMLPAEAASTLTFSLSLLPDQVSAHTGFRVIFPE